MSTEELSPRGENPETEAESSGGPGQVSDPAKAKGTLDAPCKCLCPGSTKHCGGQLLLRGGRTHGRALGREWKAGRADTVQRLLRKEGQEAAAGQEAMRRLGQVGTFTGPPPSLPHRSARGLRHQGLHSTYGYS